MASHGLFFLHSVANTQEKYSVNGIKSETLPCSNNQKALWHQQGLSHSALSSQSISPNIHYSNNTNVTTYLNITATFK